MPLQIKVNKRSEWLPCKVTASFNIHGSQFNVGDEVTVSSGYGYIRSAGGVTNIVLPPILLDNLEAIPAAPAEPP